MSLYSKRISISDGLRKQDRESYFRKIRMSLQTEEEVQESLQTRASPSGQQQILEAIQSFRKNSQPLSFPAINNYILASQFSFSRQFVVQLITVVLEHYRKNGYAIAAIAHLLSKLSQAPFLGEIEAVSDKIGLLLEENVDRQNNTIKNGRAIAFLVFNLLSLGEHKEDYHFLPKYYSNFTSTIGFYDKTFLLMIQIASHCRQLLPEQPLFQAMLTQQPQYHRLEPLDFKIICQFFQNCVLFDLFPRNYHLLVKWIYRRLKERKFPSSLKQSLLKIFTIMLRNEMVSAFINADDSYCKIVQEIIGIARFGSIDCRPTALTFLQQLVNICNQKRMQFFVQNTQILEALVYSLDLPLSNEQLYKVLQSIAYLLGLNQNYLKLGFSLGIMAALYRIANSSAAKSSQMAQLILQFYKNSQ